MNCTRCQGTGFLNLQQMDDRTMSLFGAAEDWHEAIRSWLESERRSAEKAGCSCHISPPCPSCQSLSEVGDIQVCDCCGDGENWYGVPGEHAHFTAEYQGHPQQEPFPECY